MTMRLRFFLSNKGNAEIPSSSGISTSSTTTSGSMDFDLLDRLAPGAQSGRSGEIGLGIDPTSQQPAHDGCVVDDHHADRLINRRYARSGGSNITHSLDFQNSTVEHRKRTKARFLGEFTGFR